MVSRLDRLFILLDTGSNESVRLAAAKQLGQVQRIQPNELDYLLDRIKEYSSKPVWETRIAAGHAIRCILEHVPPWPPSSIGHDDISSHEDQHTLEQKVAIEQILKEFNLNEIVAQCPSLLSNVLHSDDLDSSSSSRNTTGKGPRGRGRKSSSSVGGGRSKPNKEQLQRQRQLINKELGIAMVGGVNIGGVGSTDIISNDDLQTDFVQDSCDTITAEKDVGRIVSKYTSNYSKILDMLGQTGRTTKSTSTLDAASSAETNQMTPPGTSWPLENVARYYEKGLFNASWEVRHGSAIALREIVKLHGRYAGRRGEFTKDINDYLNQVWLVDTALKSLCILGLDRFGDFLFDQVVAPVRENAAQLLGCCVALLTKSNANLVFDILLKMLNNSCWETRHGGILGLKYSISVLEREHIKEIIHHTFDAIFKCLADSSDDVSAEAAASLVPVKGLLLETIPEKAPKLIKFLWEHLTDLDELTSSTSNIILLLASLITSSSTHLESDKLIEYIPKLWPLVSHSSTSVRVSVLKALITLIELQNSPCALWMPSDLLSITLRLIFQRSILENMNEVRSHLEDAWIQLTKIHSEKTSMPESRLNLLKSTSQYLNYWLCLTMQPSRSPIDRGYALWLNIRSDGTVSDVKPDGEIYIGSSTFNSDTMEQQKVEITNCRILSTKLLGILFTNLVGNIEECQHSRETLKYLSDVFVHYLSLKSANQRMISGWTIESWACHQLSEESCDKISLPETLLNQLKTALQETTLCYDELATAFTRLQQEARDFVSSLVAANVKTNLPVATDRRVIYNLSQLQYMCDLNIDNEMNKIDAKKSSLSNNCSHDIMSNQIFTSIVNKKTALSKSYQTTMASQRNLSISTLSSLACALISWASIPDNLNLLICPLLDSIESDGECAMQEKSARYLVKLIEFLCSNSNSEKETIQTIINRLIDALYSSWASITLNADEINLVAGTLVKSEDEKSIDAHRIILLDSLQRKADQYRNSSRRQSSTGGSTSSLKRSISQTSACELEPNDSAQEAASRLRANEVKNQGISRAFNLIVDHFAHELPQRLPQLWQTISSSLKAQMESYTNEQITTGENNVKLIKGLTVLQVVGQSLDTTLRANLFALFADLTRILNSYNPLIRHQVCRCIGMISKLEFRSVEGTILNGIIPMLESSEVTSRCGAIEAIAFIIEQFNLELVPRVDMFIVHVLRRMSDQNDQVRMMATHCFGKLLSLMPLNCERDRLAKELADEKSSMRSEESDFIEQLLDPTKLKNHRLPFETSVPMRSYQQEGLNWLAFLNRFNLHGILCDEMGLGKTFMTICIVASDHFSGTGNEGGETCSRQAPSLIVCPPTLVEHWLYEIQKFVPTKTRSILNPIAYGGNVSERISIKNRLSGPLGGGQSNQKPDKKAINLIVTSYDVFRNDTDFFRAFEWNYCVLDEGHIIKNGKTKLSKAVRLITARHRLILSGTPIQNNVTELWSLFDFLMPGFLGSERQFNSRYTKPILQSREPKCSSRDLEAGALAMESLHRQVLPFILRRLKDDVLDDLPPKIMQDYYCELSPLQSKLYEDFTKGKLCNDVTKKSIDQLDSMDASVDIKNSSKSHVFQALQYLKSVCNHPKLVLTPKHSQYSQIKKYLESERSTLDDINHSSKLRALKQLLIDCGIGMSEVPQQGQLLQQQQQATTLELESVVNQHRALIFCQLRSMVEIIENDLFKKHLPSITYLRLDGSVPTNQRQSIVSRFNNDPSIDVLLLTTQIGGLGLNLTGADTVIFVEHDWNPTRDLQAMDRAHRIGQKKVVNVYRLITKDTLEEKIMGLQKFKTMVSSTVINQDNTGLNSMNVDQLLDLFEADTNDGCPKRESSGKQSAADLLPELWDQQQYETEYNLDTFVTLLKS